MTAVFEPFQLGKYLVLRRIGRGGMAEVYLAKTEGAGRFEKRFAIKRLLSPFCDDPQFIAMFEQEATLFSLLDHPNIAQVYDFQCVDDTYLLVMEYIDGATASQTFPKLASSEAFPRPAVAAFLVSEVLKGLEYAHQKLDETTGLPLGIIHRDISPQNIMMTRNGVIKIIDFGIARMGLSQNLTRPGTLKGKLGYSSPEQIEGLEVDHRTDIYSSAVVLYEFLTGQHLFEADNEGALIRKILEGAIPDLSTDERIPHALVPILYAALAQRPEDRISSAGDFRAYLDSFLQNEYSGFGQSHLAALWQQVLPYTDSLSLDNTKEIQRSGASSLKSKSIKLEEEQEPQKVTELKTVLIELSPSLSEATGEEYPEMVTQVTSVSEAAESSATQTDSGQNHEQTVSLDPPSQPMRTDSPSPVTSSVEGSEDESLALETVPALSPDIQDNYWATKVRKVRTTPFEPEATGPHETTLASDDYHPWISADGSEPSVIPDPTPPAPLLTPSLTDRSVPLTSQPYQEVPDYLEPEEKRIDRSRKLISAALVVGLVFFLCWFAPQFLPDLQSGNDQEASIGNLPKLNIHSVPQHCLLNLSTDPPVADVYVNEKRVGETPSVVIVPCSGGYALRVEKKGFESTVRQISAEETLDKWYVTLHPSLVGRVEIRMDFNAALFVDDVPAGQITTNQTFEVVVTANQPHRLRIKNEVLGIDQVRVMEVAPERVFNTSLLLSDVVPAARRNTASN